MRRKRLFCVCAILTLLLASPARAVEPPPAEDEFFAPEVIAEEVPAEEGSPEEAPFDEESTVEDSTEEEFAEEEPTEEDPTEEEPIEEDPTEEEPIEEKPYEEEISVQAKGPAETIEVPVEPGTLNVVLPSNAWVVVNPYGLEVNRDGVLSREQIVSAPMSIINYSAVPVAVLASATGYALPGSEAVFVSAPLNAGAREKELFLFAEFSDACDEYGGASWSGQYTGASNQLPVTADELPPVHVMTLAAGDRTPAYGAIRLFGSAAVPLENPWRSEDAIQVTFAFTFLPA